MNEFTGVIYILTNPSFPEYVKIGYADDLERRINQLNSSEAVPFSFRPYAYYETTTRLTDIEVHDIIDRLNPNLRSVENAKGKKRVREFYLMTPEDAFAILKSIATISGTIERLHKVAKTEEDKQEEKEAKEGRARRRAFTFSMLHIPLGSQISYVDDPSKTATVEDDRHISYVNENGQKIVTSVSAYAQILLHSKYGVQGPHYFTYQGQLLSDLYERYYPSED